MKSSFTLNSLLDVLHTTSTEISAITRRRRRIRREHIIAFVNIASTIVSALTLAFPQVRNIANILNKLQKADDEPIYKMQTPSTRSLIFRLQALDMSIKSAIGEERIRLEAQRDMLLKLMCENKQTAA